MKEIDFTLHPFQKDRTSNDISITGSVGREREQLTIRYRLQGALHTVRLPPPAGVVLRSQRLWEQTCFECFIASDASDMYWEINLSPAGHWNVYRFDAYRQGMQEEAAFKGLPVGVSATADSFCLTAAVDLKTITSAGRPLDIALSTVIRTMDDQITCWSLIHPGPAPDFHRRDTFIITL